MKKFLVETFAFVSCLTLVIQGVGLLLPYCYGNEFFEEKEKVFSELKEEINLVVFGSSSIHHQFYPMVFDTCLKGLNIQSFNLGVEATMNPESYFLYENFIESVDSGTLKYSILEITPLSSVSNRNLFKERTGYWKTPSQISYIFNYIKQRDLLLSGKVSFFGKHLISYVYACLDIGKFRHLSIQNESKIVIELNGFDPYLGNKEMNNEIRLKNSKRKKASELMSSQSFEGTVFNSEHLSRLIQLKEKSRQKGIQLIFLINPRLNDYSLIHGALAEKELGPIINLASYQDFPEFYEVENLYDRGHLNYKGSIIYSQLFAKKFRDLILPH